MNAKKFNILITGILIAVFGFLSSFSAPVLSKANEPADNGNEQNKSGLRKIVVFEEGASLNEDAKDEIIRKTRGIKIKSLKLINGTAVYLPDKSSEDALAKIKGVKRIEEDIIVNALDKKSDIQGRKGNAIIQSQTLPWGVNRIDAELVWNATTADNIKVGLIDTGIDLNHPDLAGNIKGGVNTINLAKSPNDDNGHGTHVAGIIGAMNNNFGVVGVGPKIDLYAVKVLNANGSGFLSDVIEGLDWAVVNNMNVINMSLGTPSFSQAFYDAVKRVNAAGIVQVAAAGNSGPGDNSVDYPAKFPEVIAVSATDSSDNAPFWSSRGPEVDLAAPGVSVFSTYRNRSYKTLSGTSMASPHVAGTAALLLSNPSKCEFLLDVNPGCSPAEVQKRLEDTAEQVLPDTVPGKDLIYGSGLVNALAAVLQ